MEYVLEIKQIVDYPRIRIYREFIQKLISHDNLSARGNCNLFNYIILCSYANYSSSRKRIEGKEYIIQPGSWICSFKELIRWFRTNKEQCIEVLSYLEGLGFIEYYQYNEYIFYKIINWDKYNSFMEYEAHCHKDDGFFFFPYEYIEKFMGNEQKCSEKDIIIDLWLNTIYNDQRVDGSEIGPVVYFRNGTGNPRTTYSYLSRRWNSSKASVGRVLEKLQANGYITYLTFSGRYGTAIYLNGYLSLMFDISDIPVDKAEVAFALKLKIKIDDDSSEEDSVSNEKIIVSKNHLEIIQKRVEEILPLCGFECVGCKQSSSILYRLSLDCNIYMFKTICSHIEKHKFLIQIKRE